jgi:hypothetical protein
MRAGPAPSAKFVEGQVHVSSRRYDHWRVDWYWARHRVGVRPQSGARVVVSGRHADAGRGARQVELRDTRAAEAEFVEADVRHEDDVRNLSIGPSRASGGSISPSTMPAPKASRAPLTEQTTDAYSGDFRHQRPRHPVVPQTRVARHASLAGQRQHRQPVVDRWPPGAARRAAVRRQQACGRRADQGGGARRRRELACGSTRLRPVRSRR